MVAEGYFEMLSQAEPAVRLQHLNFGYRISHAITVAAELGIADLLADGPRPSTELAAASGSHPSALYRLLRALASVGLFSEVEPRRFALTEMGALLQEKHPRSMRALTMNRSEGDEVWSHLRYSVETGLPVRKQFPGTGGYEYRAQHPEANAAFNAAMVSTTRQLVEPVADAYDFSELGTVVDVGGGHGTLIAAILGATPGLHGVLFDLPHVVEGAKSLLEAAAVLDRCEMVGGDMFADVPPGGDAYVLSRVIHGTADERAAAVLTNCRVAMDQKGRLLVIEELIPPGDTPAFSKLSDLNMLVSSGGQERTEAEYRALFAAAGFELTQIIPTRSRMSIIEGRQVRPRCSPRSRPKRSAFTMRM